MPAKRTAAVAILLFLLAAPAQSSAADFDIKGGYSFRGYFEKNTIDPFLSYLPAGFVKKAYNLSSDALDSNYLLMFAYSRMSLSVADSFSLVTSLDSGVVTFNPSDEEAEASLLFDSLTFMDALEQVVFLRELYLEWGLGTNYEFLATLGKRRTVLLDGFMYDDYGFVLGAGWDFWASGGSTATVSASVIIPYRYWGDLNLDLLLSHAALTLKDFFFQTIEAGFIWLNDRAGLTSKMLHSALTTDMLAMKNWDMAMLQSGLEYTGSANIYTVYGHASLDLEVLELKGTFAMQWGSGHSQWWFTPWWSSEPVSPEGSKPISLEGYMAVAEADISVYNGVTLTPFVLAVSGISLPRATLRQYTAFTSIVPHVKYASIFFSGGMNQMLTNRDFALIGIGGAGASALGLAVQYELEDKVGYQQSLSFLSTNRPRDSFLSLNYGVEFDNILTVQFFEAFCVVAEIDILFPGEYFPSDRPILRGILGVEGNL